MDEYISKYAKHDTQYITEYSGNKINNNYQQDQMIEEFNEPATKIILILISIFILFILFIYFLITILPS